MKFYDMDSLAGKQNISNKYLLTVAVAARARALSEQKGRTLEEDNEKFISIALEEFDRGIVRLEKTEGKSGAPDPVPEDTHVAMER